MKEKTRKKYRPIYLLPSLFSLSNLFFGLLSLIMSIHGKFRWAAFWIIIAAVLDGFDGIIARATRTHSEFGTELDSLADSISFGAATSLLLYLWAFQPAGYAGIFFSFVYLSAGLLRLARYNVRSKALPDRRHYTGLTIPSAAMFMSSLVLCYPRPFLTRESSFLLALLALFISFCMISTVRYKNFLNFNLRRRIDLRSALLLAVFLAGMIFYTKIFLIGFFSINVLSGPGEAAFRYLKKRLRKKPKREVIPS
jgi:CDP-diacylglycerol--serine O-phosphatidyltransferase